MKHGQLTLISFVVALVLLPGIFSGCALKPLVQVYGSTVPCFTDDLDRGSLKLAVRHSLDYLRRQPQQQEITVAGRSIAVDLSCFPAGALAFLMTRQPALAGEVSGGWTRLSRLVLAQDTGSAIRGPGRVDLFWGAGPEAGRLAGRMKEAGSLYFLLLKRCVKITWPGLRSDSGEIWLSRLSTTAGVTMLRLRIVRLRIGQRAPEDEMQDGHVIFTHRLWENGHDQKQ